MAPDLSPLLLDILRSTLEQLDSLFVSPQDERALRNLKQTVVLAIYELELARGEVIGEYAEGSAPTETSPASVDPVPKVIIADTVPNTTIADARPKPNPATN